MLLSNVGTDETSGFRDMLTICGFMTIAESRHLVIICRVDISCELQKLHLDFNYLVSFCGFYVLSVNATNKSLGKILAK